jgi:cbb3-type cytochrome c oxidase subunit III
VTSRRIASGAVLAVVAALLLSACGTGGKAAKQGDQQNGQKLFTAKCAGCHTLAAANAQGTIGPNLDDAFGADRQQGFKPSSIQNIVLDQIREAAQPMPKNLVRGKDAEDVAAYVASVAGQGGTSTKSPSQLGNNGKAIFQAKCASCHTLKDAGTSGTIGPNLDQLKPAEPVVEHQVTVGGGVMPAFKGTLTPAQITAVAKYVSSAAGK